MSEAIWAASNDGITQIPAVFGDFVGRFNRVIQQVAGLHETQVG